jgi:hypothetical protein
MSSYMIDLQIYINLLLNLIRTNNNFVN